MAQYMTLLMCAWAATLTAMFVIHRQAILALVTAGLSITILRDCAVKHKHFVKESAAEKKKESHPIHSSHHGDHHHQHHSHAHQKDQPHVGYPNSEPHHPPPPSILDTDDYCVSGADRLMMPLCFLAEKAHLSSVVDGHSPILCYASALAAYLSLYIATPYAKKLIKGRKSAHHKQLSLRGAIKEHRSAKALLARVTGTFPLEVWSYLLVATGVLFFLSKDVFFAGTLCVYVLVSLFVECWLLPLLPSGEAHLVGQFAGYVIGQQLYQRELITRRQSYTLMSTHEYFAGQAAMLTAVLTCVIMHLLLSRSPLKVRHFLFGAGPWQPSIAAPNATATAHDGAPSTTSTSSEMPPVQLVAWKVTVVFGVVLCCALTVAYEQCSRRFANVPPIEWAVIYILGDSTHRNIILGWFAVLPISVFLIGRTEHLWRQIIRRKLFHFLALALFVPVLVIGQGPYLTLGITAAISIAVLVECAHRCGVLGSNLLAEWLAPFLDTKDGTIIRTHLYLMAGCGLALIFRHRVVYMTQSGGYDALRNLGIAVIPGLVNLGVADAFAAIVGCQVGSLKWRSVLCVEKLFPVYDNPALRHKSVQGSVAGLVAAMVSWFLFVWASTRSLETALTASYDPVFFTGIMTGALCEIFTPGTDNLVVPLLSFGAMHTMAAIVPMPSA